MRFEYLPVDGWPPLAWLARCERSSATVSLFHGSRVETTADWFCEAAWPGDYERGDFDRTDIVEGSGGRLRRPLAVFVSAGSTVDRLHVLRQDETTWVSNSLPCLLAATGGRVDVTYPNFHPDLQSIKLGVHRYRRFLSTSAGPVELVYFADLAWDGQSLTARPKPEITRDFTTFDTYYEFLATSMRLIAENAGNHRRRFPLRLLGTISSGYDSPTVTTVASRFGCAEAITFDQSHFGGDDSGAPIAEVLGVRPIVVPTDGWRSRTLPEIPFIAGSGRGEDLPLAGAEEHLAGRVLLTGNPGGIVWGKSVPDLGENLVRGTTSGLSLTEYRLWTGFIHCAPCYWGARQLRDINAISRSPEMAPWDIPGYYTRPICRRIMEEAGVPRDLFGMHKRWATVKMHRYLGSMTPGSWTNYSEWLRDHWRDWVRKGRIPPAAYLPIDRPLHAGAALVGRAVRAVGRRGVRITALSRVHPVFRSLEVTDLPRSPRWSRRNFFPWALERSIERYPRPF